MSKNKDKTTKAKADQKEAKELTDQEKILELTALVQSITADFDNYKKRVEEEKKATALYFKKEFILKFLPALDMFELSLKHSKDPEAFKQGVEMIHSQLLSLLEQEGVKAIDTKGSFDASKHEAIDTIEGEEGKIMEEVQKGYMLNDKLLRCAKVKVGKTGGTSK